MKKQLNAQSKNNNAYSDSFYTNTLTGSESQLLDKLPLRDFKVEVELIRDMQTRLQGSVNSVPQPLDSELHTAFFELVTLTAQALKFSIQTITRLNSLQTLRTMENNTEQMKKYDSMEADN